ncbi:MAG: four helix bundle protein [Bryobacteraceae bacterium]
MPPTPATPVALEKSYRLTLWLIPKIEKLPRSHRFTLGDRLYTQLLDLVTALTRATFARDKSTALEAASDRVNSIRILLRLAKDLQLCLSTPTPTPPDSSMKSGV